MSKYLIVGGVAGGATTAARLRRLDEQAEIIIFEKGKYISYANCGLPYYIGGVISERDRLFVQTPESFKQRLNIDVRIEQEVIKIDRTAKTVLVKDHKNNHEYAESYDKLVLSPGAEPLRPPIPGINDSAIFTLRSVPDTDAIKDYLSKHKVRRVVIVGAGYIGLEMAENLHHLGIFVTIVELAEQMMIFLDYEMAAEVHQHLKTKQVEFYLKDAVNSFARDGEAVLVKLQSGKELKADMVILSIGVRPDSHLAAEAGLELGVNQSIAVNEFLQTADPDIYAVGDAISFKSPITGKPMTHYLAGPANKQGRICADNIIKGNLRKYEGSIGTGIAKVFDITVASTGVGEKTLKADGIPFQTSIIHGSSHAGYYPDALPMTIKILFEPQGGKLFGAQIVGYEGVDKRMDLLASFVKCGGTIYDLERLEHAYAPPFSSAKDPVNIAGFVAENIIMGLVKIVHWQDIAGLDYNNTVLLDVRTVEEFQLGNIQNSVNIPVDDLRSRLTEIPQDKKIVVYCAAGQRAYLATRILMQSGFNEVYNLSGGYKTYEHATQKQSNEDIFERDTIGKDDHIYQYNPDQPQPEGKVYVVDACGLQCPGPILRLKQEIDKVNFGDTIRITATDPGSAKDIPAWCKMTGNKLISLQEGTGKVIAEILKSKAASEHFALSQGKNKTIVVFSDDLDKALAAFVIANGASTTGKKVTMFFTFWGLNVIKKQHPPTVHKDLMGKMFSMMLPGSSKGLGLSQINFWGLGAKLMRFRMQQKRVDSLELMIEQAIHGGVEMIGCQMSMDIMGVSKEELLDTVKIGGVATYLSEAEQANINLFI
jgi:NADPH-dependent 2,4-dienoyl-CoA reductase/sulfur reductase-like enzyme/peroxiredoxin family protein/rhodanese-related sulfurtransferase/TusA-related sulfurtransferase